MFSQAFNGAAAPFTLGLVPEMPLQTTTDIAAVPIIRRSPLSVPQGLTEEQFVDVSATIRAKAGERGLGDDIFVQGSRAAGTAKPTSDIDFAIRVSPEDFDNFLYNKSKLANANPGSAKADTLQHAIDTGKIQAGEARLSGFRKQLETTLNMTVDISVIRAGGTFDNGYQLPLRIPPK
jgi:predicted nucleotidyltransferase